MYNGPDRRKKQRQVNERRREHDSSSDALSPWNPLNVTGLLHPASPFYIGGHDGDTLTGRTSHTESHYSEPSYSSRDDSSSSSSSYDSGSSGGDSGGGGGCD